MNDSMNLESVFRHLHDAGIKCGLMVEPGVGISAWIEYGDRTERVTFYPHLEGDILTWQGTTDVARWVHDTALRLYPDGPHAQLTMGAVHA
jgi:hypothetical protein